MHPQYEVLHNRIQTFDFTPANTKVTFAHRLMREQHWTRSYTERVIKEYRRFLLLSMVAGHRVIPSDQVDQAWHLNILNSRSYWQDLCANVLGKDLHHQPNLGGHAENTNHFRDYRQTLACYQKIFGHPAPIDIWPSAEIRFGGDLNFVRVNRHDYWLFKKPIINWRSFRVIGLGAILVLLMEGCRESANGNHSVDFMIFSMVLIGFALMMFDGVISILGLVFMWSAFLGSKVFSPLITFGIPIVLLVIMRLIKHSDSRNRSSRIGRSGDDSFGINDDYGNSSSNDSSCNSDSGCGGGCGGGD